MPCTIYGNNAFQLLPTRLLKKLDQHNNSTHITPIYIKNVASLTKAEHSALIDAIHVENMAFYQTNGNLLSSEKLNRFAEQFGLTNYEHSSIENTDKIRHIQQLQQASRYIPFSNKRLGWHTDGYYHPINKAVRSFILHCNQPAYLGGTNHFIDHELLYTVLAQENRDIVSYLFDHQAMTIPGDTHNPQRQNSVQGPVCFWDNNNSLSMRYTERERHITWSNSIYPALEAIKNILNNNRFIKTIRFEAGMGVICRNVIHKRDRFVDNEYYRRSFLRARFHDSIHQ